LRGAAQGAAAKRFSAPRIARGGALA